MKQPRFALNALVSAAALLLAGCSLAPVYETPALPVAQSLGDQPAPAGTGLPRMTWQALLADSRLQSLVAQALQNNRDLRVSVLNVEKARAQYRIKASDFLPSVGASASQSRARVAAGGAGQPQVTQSAGLSVGIVSWELDLAGRIASIKEQAAQQYLSTEQAARAARVSLIAEVASRWLTEGAYQQRLRISQASLDALEEALALTRQKHELGAASVLDVSQIRAKVEAARAAVATHRVALEQARHGLELVIGAQVDATLLMASGERKFDSLALAPVPTSMPSDLLLQRPDVQAAEHALKAANANIGAARAAFFPSITLSAAMGRSGDALDGLIDATRTWSFAPTITMPIFQAGALRASLDAAKIQKNIHVAQYEKSIQTAFMEVADALSQYRGLSEQAQAQAAILEAARQAQAATDARWRNGLSSKLQALEAQQSVYTAEQALLNLELSEALNRITIYKVLGGDPA